MLLNHGVPHVPKILVAGQSNGSIWKKQNSGLRSPSLINRNMKRLVSSGFIVFIYLG
jgi:hypothetical protein